MTMLQKKKIMIRYDSLGRCSYVKNRVWGFNLEILVKYLRKNIKLFIKDMTGIQTNLMKKRLWQA